MRQQLLCFRGESRLALSISLALDEKTAQAQYSNDNYKTP
jgi:hypothetical protein